METLLLNYLRQNFGISKMQFLVAWWMIYDVGKPLKLKNVCFVCVCISFRMRAVQIKQATTQTMRDGTRRLPNLPAYAGKTYF